MCVVCYSGPLAFSGRKHTQNDAGENFDAEEEGVVSGESITIF
jgi:hypothetical protein